MKLTLFALISILFTVSVYAQKLPNTQSQSIWAGKIKVDGKLDDWNKELPAYNRENNLWYSLANDDKYLYLAVKKDKFPTKAYSRGGIKLFISTKEIKKTEGLPTITFPVIVVDGKPVPFKEWNDIDVRHIPGVTDTLISIYNDHGIQVAWNLDETEIGKIYTYELAIPLKLLSISPGQTIYYNMLLRGTRSKPLRPGQVSPIAVSTPHVPVSEEVKQRLIDSDTWTDFWATYKLATKR